MSQSTQKIWWATPPTLVGPLVIVLVIAAITFVAIFIGKGMIDIAVLTCVGAAVLLLLGLYDLLAELITIGRRIEKSLESKTQ